MHSPGVVYRHNRYTSHPEPCRQCAFSAIWHGTMMQRFLMILPAYNTREYNRAYTRYTIMLLKSLLCWLQIQPPGMHMIYLPFSDDLRHPEADPAFTGASNPQADEAQIQAAETMIHGLNLKGFDSADIPNPSLQRHYQVLILQNVRKVLLLKCCCHCWCTLPQLCCPDLKSVECKSGNFFHWSSTGKKVNNHCMFV